MENGEKIVCTENSVAIDKIMGALSAAQGEYKDLVANEQVGRARYANLKAIIAAVKDALSKNGLAFYQYIELLDEGSGAALLRTVLGHSSGQFIQSTARVFTGKTDRNTGNSYEIHKRFHALMLLGIAPSENDPMAFDDNGEEQAEVQVMERLKKPRGTVSHSAPDNVISKERYNDLLMELDGYPEILKDLLEKFQIETLADLPNEEYPAVRKQIMSLKATHDDYIRRKAR